MKTRRLSLSLKELLLVFTATGLFLTACKWQGLEPWIAVATTIYLIYSMVLLLLGTKT
jgi:hypothetical protein